MKFDWKAALPVVEFHPRMLFSMEEFLFHGWPTLGHLFPKLAGSNFKNYWIHAGQVRRKVDCSKFSLEFSFVRIAAQKESPALQQGEIHVEKWIPPLRGLCSKNLAEFDFYRIWLAASVFIYLCITRIFVTDTK